MYIAAFAPDKGESVNTLIADPPTRRPGEVAALIKKAAAAADSGLQRA